MPRSRFLELVVCPLILLLGGAAQAREEQLALKLDDGREITAHLRIPDGAHGRLPALMLFGGFQRAAGVLDRVDGDRPLVWATFDYPFEPPRKFQFPQSLEYAPQLRAAIHGSLDGVGKLYQALSHHAAVDPARITVVGASAGAPFATIGAARNPIPGVILVQGFGDAADVVRNLVARKYRPKVGAWIEWPAAWFAHWITWYCEVPDIAAAARTLRAQQKVLMVTASSDDFIPKAATESLWQALEQSQAAHQRIDLEGLHLGVGDDRERIAEILRRSMAWMEQNSLL